ncbi:hypothetical protein LXL04_013537 [Taraxacum kok-saghyz]
MDWGRSVAGIAVIKKLLTLFTRNKETCIGKLSEERCVEGLDFWYWQIDPDGKFTVAGTRNWIDEKVLPSAMCSTKWCSWVPKKVNIFVWRVLWKRLPTRVALKARGIGVESVLCPTCSDEEETVNHVISSCSVASSIWDLVTRWLQVTRNLGTGSDSLFQWLDGERMTVDKKNSRRSCGRQCGCYGDFVMTRCMKLI